MEKAWKNTPQEWLGLNSLSAKVSMSMEKTWKVAPLEWLGLNSLSAKVSMSMEKAWKNTPLAWLGLDNLSAKVSMSMEKTWTGTALEALGLEGLSTTVKIQLERDGWTTVDDFVDGFGGATGGGGSTSGGGAGRSDHSRSVPVSITGDSQDLQGQIDSLLAGLSANVKIGLEKTWKNTPLEWLGLNNLSATISMAMEKSWKVKALEWLGLDNLSATISMAMEKSWKVKALKWLGLDNLSATISMAMEKSWKVKALEWLGLNDLKSTVKMSMKKTWKTSALSWLGLSNLKSKVKMSMEKTWKTSALSWLGLSNLTAKVKVKLEKGSPNKISVSQSGDSWELKVNKKGGIFSNGFWENIPQYAGGTTNAHGSMFLAGEAGPELVGHLGGRTEVLNQSQLAATMFSAVRAAMGGVKIAATMYDGGADSDEADYEMMYRAMYDAFTAAMAGSDAREQEKMALIRRIAEKEFTTEVTASSVNRAQTRQNRRAGTTIVPVGT
jgi:hypothetical protein